MRLYPRAGALLLLCACTSSSPETEPASRSEAALPPSERPSFLRVVPDATARGADATATALTAVRHHARSFGLTAAALDDAHVATVDELPGGGTIVSLRQRQDSVEVWGQELDVVLDDDGRAIALSGRLDDGPALGAAPTRADVTAAVAVAFADWTGVALERGRVALDADTDAELADVRLDLVAAVASGGLDVDPTARVKPVWFAADHGRIPAHYVELTGRDEADRTPRGHGYVVATSGEVLARTDLVHDEGARYRVWADPATGQPYPSPLGPGTLPHPTGRPDMLPFEAIEPDLIDAEGTPPWLSDDATGTAGNNVEVSVSRLGEEPTPAPLTDDRTFDHRGHAGRDGAATDPAQAYAAATSAFYATNWFHELFYGLGFDEAAGNAQRANFGRGGVEGDPLQIDVSGVCDNASMRTPQDGRSPGMTLCLFSGAATLEADIGGVHHSFGAYGARDDPMGGFDLAGRLALSTATGCDPPTGDVAGAIVLQRLPSEWWSCDMGYLTRNAAAAGAVGLVVVQAGADPDAVVLQGSGYGSELPVLFVSRRTGDTLAAGVASGGAQVRLVRALRDSAVDMTVLGHEWAHYLFGRLVGRGTGQLYWPQPGGLNEGTADFVALLALARADDLAVAGNDRLQGVYPVGQYVLGGAGVIDFGYHGIRRFPYSTDEARNPLTLGHIARRNRLPDTVPTPAPYTDNAEVHRSGEVWATALWGCFAALVEAHGLDEARQRMLGYTVSALKAMPATPTFLDARDAFLAVAAAGAPDDEERLWRAFARRGFGEDARAPAIRDDDNNGVVESFEHPYQTRVLAAALVEGIDGTGACDHDGILDIGEAGALQVRVRRATVDDEVVVTIEAPDGVELPDGARFTAPAGAGRVFDLRIPVTVVRSPDSDRVTFTAAATGRDRRHEVAVSTVVDRDRALVARDEIEDDAATWSRVHTILSGWTRTGEPGDRRWRMAQPFFEHASLVSPALTHDGDGPLQIAFDHRFAFMALSGGVIELSTDGGQRWTDVGTRAQPTYNEEIWGGLPYDSRRRGFGYRSPAWPAMHRTVLDLGETYRGQTVHIRFRVGSDRSEEWEIDNVEVSGVRRPPFTRVVADRGACLTVDAGPDQIVDGGAIVTLAGSHGDTLAAAWTQVAGPAVALASDGEAATFTAPVLDADTELRFRLTVRPGGHTGERSDEVVVRVRSQIVVAPLADRRAVGGTAVALDASASHGAADDELTYAWRQDAGPAVTLTGADTAVVHFEAPSVAAPSVVTLTVTVGSRTRAAVASRTVSIEVLPALVVTASAVALAVPGEIVRLTATTNRAAGDAPVLRWEQVEGPAAVLDPAASEPDVAMPAPAVHSALRFRATATGTAFDERASADVVVIVAVTDAGPDREALSGAEVVLGSEQPDGVVPGVVYAWEQTEGPPATLRDRDGALVRFAAPTVTAETRLAFRLAVQSGERALGSDDVVVTVRPAPPGPVDPGPGPGPSPGPEPEPEPEDGGCGCSTSGSGAGGTLALGLAIAALLRRRPRR
jgi:uncharacterized protein (TIGR03382 family)